MLCFPRAGVFVLMSAVLLASAAIPATAAEDIPGWAHQAMEDFAAWDAQNSWPEDSVLFVGSSTIRRWNTREYFPDLPVMNRGFGGSWIAHVNHFIEETVLKYEPKVIVFYAGDNDIHGGESPEEALAEYTRFVETVQERLGETPIVFMGIKPSPSRWSDWPGMAEANRLIEAYSEDEAHLHYFDTASSLLLPNGEPDPDLFVDDELHVNDAAYEMWTAELTPLLMELLNSGHES
ncbi:MAG: GDSL-type esterase/lipase family protein [Candidatus Hydrogenedentota bacterium]